MNEITFIKNVGFTGRNGHFTSKGLTILDCEDHITFRPITTKNNLGNCSIDVPKENIDELIKMLEQYKY